MEDYEKIKLNDSDIEIIDAFIKSKHPAVAAIEKILNYHIEQSRDVRNIDRKGNMGLQALAMQNVQRVLENILFDLFPTLDFEKPTKKIGQFR